MVKIGDIVRFKFGRQPATSQGMALESRRARNMPEARYLLATAYKGPYIDLFAIGSVIKIDGEYIYVGEKKYPEEAYCIKIDNCEVIK